LKTEQKNYFYLEQINKTKQVYFHRFNVTNIPIRSEERETQCGFLSPQQTINQYTANK